MTVIEAYWLYETIDRIYKTSKKCEMMIIKIKVKA